MARSLTSLTVFDTLAVDVCRTIRYRHHLTALTGKWQYGMAYSGIGVLRTSCYDVEYRSRTCNQPAGPPQTPNVSSTRNEHRPDGSGSAVWSGR